MVYSCMLNMSKHKTTKILSTTIVGLLTLTILITILILSMILTKNLFLLMMSLKMCLIKIFIMKLLRMAFKLILFINLSLTMIYSSSNSSSLE